MAINYGKRNAGGLTASSPGDTLYIPLSFYNDSGASISIGSTLAVTDIECFKNGGVAQRATDSGYSVLGDTGNFDNRTGFKGISIQIFNTADDTGFYDEGSQYWVGIDSVTVDGRTVRFWPAVFEIGEPRANVVQLSGDTGAVAHLKALADEYDTGRLPATLDTGAVNQAVWTADASRTLTSFDVDTGLRALIADVDTGLRGHIDNVDTGLHAVLLAQDTGAIATVVWAKDARTLTSFDVDTGLRALIADLDTGLRGAIDNVDTGLHSHLDTGIVVNAVWNAARSAHTTAATYGGDFADTGEIGNAVWDEVLTGATHNVSTSAGRRLRGLQDFGVYALASVWVDEIAGTSSGTVDYEDATVNNRADDFDNAVTVAASVGLDKIHIQTNNVITLTGALSGYEVFGNDYTIAFGGQEVSDVTFIGAQVSGIATGDTGADNIFVDCTIGDTGITEIPPSKFVMSGFRTTTALGDTGDYRLIDCYSDVAGSARPTVDLAGNGSKTMEFRRWSGGLRLQNVTSGDTISVDVVSGGTIQVSGTGGTVVIRGMCSVLDTGGASVSVTKTSVINQNYVADAVWDELDTGHADTGTFGRIRVQLDKIEDDVDTGIRDGVWDATTRTLTGFAHDTGVADTVWKIQRSGYDTDTGSVAYAIGNVTEIRGDTGAAAHLATAYATAASSTDTGLIANAAAIRTQTDKLQFDTGGVVEANIRRVADTTVTGDGSSGNEWGPA